METVCVSKPTNDWLSNHPANIQACLIRALRELDDLLSSAVAARSHNIIDPLSSMRVTHDEVVLMLKNNQTASTQVLCGLSKLHEKWLDAALMKNWGLDDFDAAVLLIALAPHLNSRYERVFAFLQDDITLRHPSVHLVVRLLAISEEQAIKRLAHFLPDAPLLNTGLLCRLDTNAAESSPCLATSPLYASEAALRLVIQGQAYPLDRSTKLIRCKEEEEEEEVPSALGAKLAQIDRRKPIWLSPLHHSDVQEAIDACSTKYGRPVLASRITDISSAHQHVNQARDNGAILAVEAAHLANDNRELEDRLLALADRSQAQGIAMVAFGAEAPSATIEHAADFFVLNIPALTLTDRHRLWRQYFATANIQADEDQILELAQLLPLRSAEIAVAANCLQANNPPHVSQIQDAAIKAYHSPSRLGKHVPIRRGWADLVLADETLNHLEELSTQISVHADARKRCRLSDGLVALFTGPSGTGKTLAAEVLAGSVGFDLFRISASQIYDKYVGETEKNIDRMFELVEGLAGSDSPKTILLIDEAEWLFSGRVENKDSHDHYLNLRVGHLLQRLESYSGVAILTSNLPANLDSAFRRRWFQQIAFEMPDESARQKLWARMIELSTLEPHDVDIRTLARVFPLSGGNIRNVVVLAAYNAIAHNTPLDMHHLANAIRREYRKLGHNFHLNDIHQKLADKPRPKGRMVLS